MGTTGRILTLVAVVGAVGGALAMKRAMDAGLEGVAPIPLVVGDVPEDPVPATYETSLPGAPRLVALGAGKCIPCRAMAPVRAELRTEYAGLLALDFYDVWKNPAAGDHFGIRAIPTLIFYDAEGRELGRREGYMSKEAVLATMAELGLRLPEPRA